jgi:hypothetical protein
LNRWAAFKIQDLTPGVMGYWPSVIEEIVVYCPSCGEPFALDVDTTGGGEQSYFEDCPVCCRPAEVFVKCRPGEILSISVSAD